MSIGLGSHQYGKAETRVVRICRDSPAHQIRDLNVTSSLRGDFAAAYTRGDQSNVLPTDSQKNAAYAYARQYGAGEVEDYALALAGHFASDIEPVSAARVDVEEYRWERINASGTPHPHGFVRAGQEVRTASAVVEGKGRSQQAWVVSGLRDLIVLKSTGSEFAGFLTDPYTTLPETHDRVLATSLTARWRYSRPAAQWAEVFASVRDILLAQFASVHSLALQQTLWEMGQAVLRAHEEIAELRLSAPNKHHFLVDLAPFGLENRGEVFHADDRPYGLIQCSVIQEEAPPAGSIWESPAAFA